VLVLALDTATAAVSAAVVEVSDTSVRPRAVRQVVDARGHSENLAPVVAAALDAAGIAPGDLAAVVAGTGPGPFTGLRVGLVTAAAISAALRIPAYGLCSLDAIAPPSGAVLVATDARRREVYWADYHDGVRRHGPQVSYPADVATDGLVAMTGAGARLYADELGLPLLDIDYPDPVVLARRAREQVLAGAPAEPLVPLYLRRPDAVPPKAMSR
jgi:tRNA threonylcarbamoyl adenosine modification protein YeaZ